jgi:bifunctional enzyme CysN/CysC
MPAPSGLISTDIDAYLRSYEQRDLLRFITCGSVDDGKSTLIGRLLYESHLIFDDQLEALERDSKTVGTQGADLDFALLVDGLAAEREQGITIDVAYRFFSTDRRKFIVADTPGHEQYTRNMVTGASTADVAVILADARKGILTQTRRHTFLVSLLGIRTVVLAVNKLDLVGYEESIAQRIADEYRQFASSVGINQVTVIPISALQGVNVTETGRETPWYDGPPLLEYLETVQVGGRGPIGPFRMPVQWVNRPDSEFRGFAGQIVGGSVAQGDTIRILPSGQTATVERIITADGDLPSAIASQSVTLTLTQEIDVSRGDMLASAHDPAAVADQFEADIIWMGEQPMLPGRPYLVKLGTRTVGATIAQPKYKINVNTLEHVAARTLELNEIGVCNVNFDRVVPYDSYTANRETGGFIVIDRLTNTTVGAGLIHFALRRADNVHRQLVEVDKARRTTLAAHQPCVIWFTGLSGSGKSTIANLTEQQLHGLRCRTYLLDGDNVRLGLNKDLGFTDADRVENIRRVAEVARLMVDAGLIVLVAFISPFAAERAMARALVGPDEFIEVHIDAPLAIAEGRDPKGLYKKARRGLLTNFTGIDSPYEPPEQPDFRIDTTITPAGVAAESLVAFLASRGITIAK